MGRTLEALKRDAKPHTDEDAPESVPSPTAEAEADPDEENAAPAEVPYIEVGGRGKLMDASPSVLVSSPPPVAAKSKSLRLVVPSPRPAVLAEGQRGFEFQPVLRTGLERSGRVAAEIVAFHDPAHPVSEQYRQLFAKIQEGMRVPEPYVLLFTAASRGVGTTTAVLNLAVTGCAAGRRRVAVVDANMSRPAAASRLGVTPAAGLAEVLRGTAALEQALAVTPVPALHLLAAAGPNDGAGLLVEDNLRWLAARLRERFDLVFVDGPAWEGDRADLVLAALAEAVYLVVDSGETENPAVRQATRALAQRGSRLGGLIVIQ
jgi:Mrp family chromosome partitioning ATPase